MKHAVRKETKILVCIYWSDPLQKSPRMIILYMPEKYFFLNVRVLIIYRQYLIFILRSSFCWLGIWFDRRTYNPIKQNTCYYQSYNYPHASFWKIQNFLFYCVHQLINLSMMQQSEKRLCHVSFKLDKHNQSLFFPHQWTLNIIIFGCFLC